MLSYYFLANDFIYWYYNAYFVFQAASKSAQVVRVNNDNDDLGEYYEVYFF